MDLSDRARRPTRARLTTAARRSTSAARRADALVYGGINPLDIDRPPGRSRPNLAGARARRARPRHPRHAEPPRHRPLDPRVRRRPATRSRSDGDTNVLATPHILATDNIRRRDQRRPEHPAPDERRRRPRRARRRGGRGAARRARSAALGGLGGGGFAAPRQDVGTKIKVTPHLNDSDRGAPRARPRRSATPAPPHGRARRRPDQQAHRATRTLVVRDQQTVVIGGLVRDAVTHRRDEDPGPRRHPGARRALPADARSTKQKTNLLLVLTPYIIREQDDLRAIFERKMQERQEFLDRYFVFSDEHDCEPPQGLLARERPRRGHPPVDHRAGREERASRTIAAEATLKIARARASRIALPAARRGGRGAGAPTDRRAAGAAAPATAAAARRRPRHARRTVTVDAAARATSSA